ncbi:MAG: hypothetical protein U0T33_10245 [Bacteroidales bacterium]
MKNSFLYSFPSPETIVSSLTGKQRHRIIPNNHIHTPWSFSAFNEMNDVFDKASSEGINVLGINDFFVTDGYDTFHDGCTAKGIFPLFNIEFIGLIKELQLKGTRINDPNNAGRIYFCGKGLDYPARLSPENSELLGSIREESQEQIRRMIAKVNALPAMKARAFALSYEDIRKRFAKELVRERHIARAIRILALEKFKDTHERAGFFEEIFNGRKSKAGMDDTAALENEIRSLLLKSGGSAYVEEDESSFLPVEKIISIILDAGGIPCYPVLLDDPAGNYTEFESDYQSLYDELKKRNVPAVELIPGRNSLKHVERFTGFFDSRGFIVTFGTEHNTPDLIPLGVTARHNEEPGENVKQTAARGVCIIAAHQYLRSRGLPGYIGADGRARFAEKEDFEKLGLSVIEYFLEGK